MTSYEQARDLVIELLTEQGMTRKEFAQRLGTQPSAVTNWLNGVYDNWTLGTLDRMAEALGHQAVIVLAPKQGESE